MCIYPETRVLFPETDSETHVHEPGISTRGRHGASRGPPCNGSTTWGPRAGPDAGSHGPAPCARTSRRTPPTQAVARRNRKHNVQTSGVNNATTM